MKQTPQQREELPPNYEVVMRTDVGMGKYWAIAKVKTDSGEHCAFCFFNGIENLPLEIQTYPIKEII